jgi:uncharacterized protein YgbK (DUF1537 family)
VLTVYDAQRLESVLREAPAVIFLLTNSRSMTCDETRAFHERLVGDLKTASLNSNREIEIISRSDSTLRGHYPIETDVIVDCWPEQTDLVLLMPFFLEGGRLTINGQHYVQENDRLVPAHETPFANDAVFGFKHSYMPKYVEEKTRGKVTAKEVIEIPVEEIRKGPDLVCQILDSAPNGSVCVADGVVDSDAQIVATAVGQSKRKILARVAASYVRARAGLEKRPLLSSKDLLGDEASQADGGLIIVGSHVPKSTAQLSYLLEHSPSANSIELPVSDVLDSEAKTIAEVTSQVNKGMKAGKNVILFTSRSLAIGSDDAENLRISKAVSSALVFIVQQLTNRPKFLVAKGGITSSDIATEALGVERATVVGSILPGVPVWRLGDESKFPKLNYVIFPGNVGGDAALHEVLLKLV